MGKPNLLPPEADEHYSQIERPCPQEQVFEPSLRCGFKQDENSILTGKIISAENQVTLEDLVESNGGVELDKAEKEVICACYLFCLYMIVFLQIDTKKENTKKKNAIPQVLSICKHGTSPSAWKLSLKAEIRGTAKNLQNKPSLNRNVHAVLFQWKSPTFGVNWFAHISVLWDKGETLFDFIALEAVFEISINVPTALLQPIHNLKCAGEATHKSCEKVSFITEITAKDSVQSASESVFPNQDEENRLSRAFIERMGDEKILIVERTFCEDVSQVKVSRPPQNRQSFAVKDARQRPQNSQQCLNHHLLESAENSGLSTGNDNDLIYSRPVPIRRRLPDVEADGRLSDSISDPPGQQSVYVRPGDTRREDYRLSTFEKFPVTCPISRKSLSRSGFYFTGFFDRVKCFACGRTVEQWEATDNPAELRWHKPSCPFPRGEETGNVPMMNLFHTSSVSSNLRNGAQESRVLEQRDSNTGALIRRVRYAADLPQRIRQTGGTFEIGEGNTLIIQNGGSRSQSNAANRIHGESVQQQPSRQWRMANVVSGDVRRFLTNLYLNRELDRLTSFARWPVSRPNISPALLAKSGFFYLGDMDRTQCFSCGGVLRNWTLEDDAFTEHRSHFPQCRMVLGTETRNFPVSERPESQQERDTRYPCRFPVNPHMRSEAGRGETFDLRWRTGRTAATSAEIAQAGFFFLGERDRVKCWYCNGGLQNWEYDDVPWIEHAKWFPNCQFLLKVKGQHFVYRHLSPHPHLARPIITRQDGSPLDAVSQPSRSRDVVPRSPTPPPTIIDPRAEMNKQKEKVKNVMENSEVVKTVLLMGFEAKIVEGLIEDRVNSGTEANPDDVFEGVTELLEAVTEKEVEMQRERESRDNQASANSAVAVAAAGPSSYGTVSSIYSSFSGSSLMSSLGPAPGSGKFNVSYFDDDDEDDARMDDAMYSSEIGEISGAAAIPVKKFPPVGAEGVSKMSQESANALEEERLCKICYSNVADMVYLPCSHMCCCMECTEAIRHCPVCRERIEKALKTYTD